MVNYLGARRSLPDIECIYAGTFSGQSFAVGDLPKVNDDAQFRVL